MKLARNEYDVAEREDVSYQIIQNTWSTTNQKKYMRYMVEIHYRPQNSNLPWHTTDMNENGYKTERTAMAAIRRHAAKRGYTLIED